MHKSQVASPNLKYYVLNATPTAKTVGDSNNMSSKIGNADFGFRIHPKSAMPILDSEFIQNRQCRFWIQNSY